MPDAVESYPWGQFHLQGRARPMLSFHRHNEIELCLLRSGRLVYQMEAARVDLPPGRLCAFWGGVPHRWLEWSEELEMRIICLPMDFLFGLGLPVDFVRSLMEGRLAAAAAADELDALLLERWAEDLRTGEAGLHWILEQELGARMRRLAGRGVMTGGRGRRGPGAGGGGALTRLLQVLTEAATQGDLVSDLAERAGLHPKYAMRLFKRECGVGLLEYVHQLRVSHAQRLLATSEAKVVDVAFASGFRSCAQFYEAFRRLAGESPGAYRARLRAGVAPGGRGSG